MTLDVEEGQPQCIAALAYMRASCRGGGDVGKALSEQFTEIELWCYDKPCWVVEEFAEVDVYPRNGVPYGLDMILYEAKNNVFGYPVILVSSFSMIADEPDDQSQAVLQLAQAGISVISISETPVESVDKVIARLS